MTIWISNGLARVDRFTDHKKIIHMYCYSIYWIYMSEQRVDLSLVFFSCLLFPLKKLIAFSICSKSGIRKKETERKSNRKMFKKKSYKL